MSHTPGPWKFKVVDETDSLLGCKRLDGGSGSTVIDLSNEWTGYPECGQDLQMTISKGDAALITAAPEMLEVLKALVSMVDSGDYRQEILDLAEAAIRKARGGGDGMTTEFTGSHEMDACVWAEEFCKRNPDADEDLMRGWFANAIMAGYDVASYKKDDEIRRLEAEKAELLAALEMVSSKLYYCDGDYYWYEATFTPGERDEIHAAIKKARGEE